MAARTNVQKASMAVGAVFLLVGVLGFAPGITGHYDADREVSSFRTRGDC
ncbi:DUF4383 domain-containing protein [Arthrobacter sp. Soil736]